MLSERVKYLIDSSFWYIFFSVVFFLFLFFIILAYNVVLLRRLSSQLRAIHSNVCRSILDVANQSLGRETADCSGEVCSSVRGREGFNIKAKVSESKG